MHTAHVTRQAHQVTAAALYILKSHAYGHYCEREATDDQLKFEYWSYQRGEAIPQFQYWSIMLELELLLHISVRSLTELAGRFHALDHTKYTSGFLFHLKDLAEHRERHPEKSRHFHST